MSTTIETGLADLITIYEVRAHLLALRPDLADAVTVDGERPVLTLRLATGAAVTLERSDRSTTGWAVTSPAVHGIVTPALGAAGMADAMASLVGILGPVPMHRVAWEPGGQSNGAGPAARPITPCA